MFDKNTLRYLWLIFPLMINTACTQIQVEGQVTNKPIISSTAQRIAWEKRQAILSNENSWKLKSRVALQFQDDSWTFGLLWLQQELRQYSIDITNPITGALVAKLRRNGESVSLLLDNGQTYNDIDEERLLAREASFNLPIKGMQYWVRGVISPKSTVDKLVLDPLGRPLIIQQSGWNINYSSYLDERVDAMPRKMIITRDDNGNKVVLKLIAKKWR